MKKLSGKDSHLILAKESCDELTSFDRFAIDDVDDTTLFPAFYPSTKVSEVSNADDVSDEDEGQGHHDSPLTLRLVDALKCRRRQTRRGKRRCSELAGSVDDPAGTSSTLTASKTSPLTVKRRGKGAAIYVNSTSLGAAETGPDDADDFVVVEGPPSRRSRWMDADLDTTEQRCFTCSLSRLVVSSLGQRFGRRVVEGRSTPRRYLVDLTDHFEEELVAVDDRMKLTSSQGDEETYRRLFLIVEEIDPSVMHRFNSTSGHVTCRSVCQSINQSVIEFCIDLSNLCY